MPLHLVTHSHDFVGEIVNLEVNTFASETSDFELTGRGLEFIPCLGNDDSPKAAPLSLHRIKIE